MIDCAALLPEIEAAARRAGEAVLAIYRTDFEVERKADESPVTQADLDAERIILDVLRRLTPDIPAVAEEEVSAGRVPEVGDRFWLVDPLDGTREFLSRNGEFTVNIALIHKDTPILGVVAVPVTHEIYYAADGRGAYVRRDGVDHKLERREKVDLQQEGLRVVASRSHMNDETQRFIDSLRNPGLVSAGSSLKFMLLASGKADVYPRYAPTMEWDTAAAHAVVREAGFEVTQFGTSTPLRYNKESLLNPYFLVR